MPSSSEKIVMAFGTFDYFHAGHENFLKQAKALGDILIVVVARDETVKNIKNRKANYPERRRLRDVLNCKHVDKAVLGNLDDKYRVIKKHKPDILALGYDQFIFTYGLKQLFIKEKLNTEVIRMQAFKPEAFKSSVIRQAKISAAKSTAPCDQASLSASKD